MLLRWRGGLARLSARFELQDLRKKIKTRFSCNLSIKSLQTSNWIHLPQFHISPPSFCTETFDTRNRENPCVRLCQLLMSALCSVAWKFANVCDSDQSEACTEQMFAILTNQRPALKKSLLFGPIRGQHEKSLQFRPIRGQLCASVSKPLCHWTRGRCLLVCHMTCFIREIHITTSAKRGYLNWSNKNLPYLKVESYINGSKIFWMWQICIHLTKRCLQ